LHWWERDSGDWRSGAEAWEFLWRLRGEAKEVPEGQGEVEAMRWWWSQLE
jgi:uncharacterized cupin superfamily protein